jgi:hypothetical protein
MDGYYRRKKITVLPVGWSKGFSWTKELANKESAQGTNLLRGTNTSLEYSEIGCQ